MIVRIATEGQYELDGGEISQLDKLDNEAVAACEAGDAARFYATYERLVQFVRSHGRRIDDEQLAASDLILPPPDVSFDEARSEFTGEGLLPG